MRNPSSVIRRSSFAILAALLLQGCQSYTIVQRNVFADDDGNIVSVEYGRSESDHMNTFISPATGKEMEFKSKLVVVATLPDGKSVKAWQCMNFMSRGTMYRTDSDEWMLLMNGFSCTIYRQLENDETKYKEVYRGVLCEIDDSYKARKDDKWRKIPNNSGAR